MPKDVYNSHYEKLPNGEVRCIDDEIPFEIPENWAWCRISDISQSYIGLTYSPSDVNDNGTIVLRSSNIKDGKLDLTDIVRVNKVINDKLRVNVNDIIICARNGSRKLVGKSALITEIHEPMTFGAFMAICKTALYKYVYLFLQSDLFFSQLRKVSDTTTINQLTQNNFNGFLLPIPPIKEQERIIAKYQDLLPIVEQYGECQEQLDILNTSLYSDLKKSILHEAIQGRLIEQSEEDEPATELLKRIQQEKQKLVKEGKLKAKDITDSIIYKGDDNKYYEKCGNAVACIDDEIPFEIPNNWQWCRLSTLVQITTGKKDANFGDEKGIYDFFTCSNTPLKCKSYSYEGDYLIMPGNGANIGQIIHYTGKFEAYQRTYLLQAYSSFDLEYLKYHLMCNWKEYNQGKLYGSAIPYIKLGNLTAYLVALPPIEEQKRIVTKVNHALASIMSR